MVHLSSDPTTPASLLLGTMGTAVIMFRRGRVRNKSLQLFLDLHMIPIPEFEPSIDALFIPIYTTFLFRMRVSERQFSRARQDRQ
jgi:hypothetical protein